MLHMPDFGHLLTIEDFADHVGGTYRADATPAPVELRLDRIDRTPGSPLGLRDPFTLIFSTPFSALLTGGTYQLRAPCGRVVAIDLAPTQSMPGPRRSYHAVFA